MTKRTLNQNSKSIQKLIDIIEPDFIFSNKPLNRTKTINISKSVDYSQKLEKLEELKKQLNSIENCNLKINSKNLIIGDGDINSPLMIVGETPGYEEDRSGLTFQGEIGDLLKKMFLAININLESIYKTYSINFRPPDDRRPSSQEMKRYSVFLKEHISIIDPKIIILLGGTAMEALTGLNSKITDERGKWKEIILKNKSYPLLITYNPSYLLRYPEYKRHSWEDLKKIREQIKKLKIKIK
jgi:uracil-DNA glycosylase family 4